MSDVVAPDAKGIARAAKALREGRLVVFPTETVYGVGAHALDEAAVKGIFAAKDRPADNPLIVHVPDVAAARRLARAWPEAAERLARAFWPGPLTLVLMRERSVPDITTGGLDTVALRVPSHGVARLLLQAAGVPVAAPSANRSGRPSPTRVQDARLDLGDAVDVYLDGGPTDVGLESTVVALVDAEPTILRLGALARERIEEVVGPVRAPAHDEAERPRSPGTKYRHYAPRARLHVVEGDPLPLALALRTQGRRAAIVCPAERDTLVGRDVRKPGRSDEPEAWARALFALLRDLDAEGYDDVVVEAIPERGVGAAVMDRLRRARGWL
ncbi:MAG TPA: L-threonylcarbamoyladenylate synthase, partial [Candidatus Thermoplasmatota archaeon]|nr:L-threonylcarbamoyladenylate synthase [Candidatus Thermoplasmatota archaeon]